jgi:hypothetical protein
MITGFLTKRKYTGIKTLHRYILSNLIYLFQGEYTHTFAVFEYNGKIKVRDMDWYGTSITEYEEYISKYKGRMVEEYLPDTIFKDNYNRYCMFTITKYEWLSLFIKHPLRIIFNINFKDNTPDKATCVEDTIRCINTMYPNLIKNIEIKTPTELHSNIQKLNKYDIR